MVSQFKNLIQLLDFFKEEKTCTEYLAKSRWADNVPCCPHCGNVGAYITNRGYKCKAKECGKKFTVITGTIFENTKISLRYWFGAIYLATNHKKGISSLQLSRDLNVTQKTAWFILHRVREMLTDNAPEMLTGTVEVDETYVGGKKANKHQKVRKVLKEGRGMINKTPVIAMLQRDGKIVTAVTPVANGEVLKPFIYKHVAPGSTVFTDGFGAYNGLNKTYIHEIVRHDANEYVRVGGIHTNSIEGFWSQLKRGIIGIYHNVSPKHLHRYAHEFGYRYNTRKVLDVDRFEDAIKNADAKRLTYKRLIA
ncbi:MAG: IS1595 family transposase [Sphingobacteriaceae bacterium]|nr:MAG: IS1595 family transposase [Sphingobacteriaceae bacterium]